MRCISCENESMSKFSNDSFFELPVFQCKKCDLCVTGDSQIESIKKIELKYQKDFWGSGKLWDAQSIINSNFTDLDSQGKKRQWTSQYKYCKPYLKNKKSILEIGAGQGQTLFWFKNEGFVVKGVEPDSNNVKLINQKSKNSCIVGTAENFQINEKFDCVWMSHVLEHVIKPEQFLKNIHKNLKKESIFFIEVPNCGNKIRLKKSIEMVPHTFHFSQKSLINLVKKTGFKVIKTDILKPATKLDGILNKLTNSRIQKYQYYPRVISNNSKGEFLRILLTI